MPTTQDIVQKLWNLCHILRDDGITYHEYVPQLDRAILAKAFRGELVSQDPDDEPAEAMLARLNSAEARRSASTEELRVSTRTSADGASASIGGK